MSLKQGAREANVADVAFLSAYRTPEKKKKKKAFTNTCERMHV